MLTHEVKSYLFDTKSTSLVTEAKSYLLDSLLPPIKTHALSQVFPGVGNSFLPLPRHH